MTIASNKSEVRVVEYVPDDTFLRLLPLLKNPAIFPLNLQILLTGRFTLMPDFLLDQ